VAFLRAWPAIGLRSVTPRFPSTSTLPGPQCTRRQREPRELVLPPRLEHEALRLARRHQHTQAFRVQYAGRAVIEIGESWAGTPSGTTRHSHFAALRPAARSVRPDSPTVLLLASVGDGSKAQL